MERWGAHRAAQHNCSSSWGCCVGRLWNQCLSRSPPCKPSCCPQVRAGRRVQEVHVVTKMSPSDMRATVQRVLRSIT